MLDLCVAKFVILDRIGAPRYLGIIQYFALKVERKELRNAKLWGKIKRCVLKDEGRVVYSALHPHIFIALKAL